jgi:GT2 family glycosyltransferase
MVEPAEEVTVSVIIPTWRRTDQLRRTLQRIEKSAPLPAEILVHVDAGDTETAPMLRSEFPQVRVVEALKQVGPGGGRNRMMAMSTCPIVVSFDDDSFPQDVDFCAEAARLMMMNPRAAVFAGIIVHDEEKVPDRNDHVRPVADFVGCGAVLRRTAFMETDGYLALRHAYGAEEVDLTLQLHDRGWLVLQAGSLRIRHATTLAHHSDPVITSASVTNLARVAHLRYPVRFWGWGALQVLNRVLWLLLQGRWTGVMAGLVAIPNAIRQQRGLRRPVSPDTLRRVRMLRRQL